jgi:hypothetical protein
MAGSIGLVSFGDGSLAYRRAARRVAKQALEFPQVSNSIALRISDLKIAFPEESAKIQWGARGLGFWAWKPLAVLFALKNFESEVSQIIFADGGCWMNSSTQSQSRLEQWAASCEASGAITFSSGAGNSDRRFSKREAIDILGLGVELDDVQRAGGVFMMNRDYAKEFSQEWWAFCQNPILINDEYDPSLQDPCFVEHRHDQSIFSLMSKNLGIPVMPDILDIHPANGSPTPEQLSVPIWASRHRSGMNSLSMNPILRALRMIEQKLP